MIPRLARPYAKAFMDTAGDLEAAIAARDQLRVFARALADVPALGAMAQNPAIPADVKARVLEQVADCLGVQGLARRLIAMLLSRFRLLHLPGVLAAIDEHVDRGLGVVSAKVQAPDELDDEQRGQLQKVLERALDKKVRLEVAVNQSLLGGFVAQVGSDRYDVSLRGQLDRISRQLSTAANAER